MSAPEEEPGRTRRGLTVAAVAFGLWGVFPLYWRVLSWVPSHLLICLRVVCCVPVLLAVLAWKKELGPFRRHLFSWKVWQWHALTASLLGLNWAVFIWATHHARILEASLGYFLTPLANVLMGAFILREKLSRWQWTAVGIAAVGVAFQFADTGQWPWVAVSLCVTFSLYGLLRKQSHLNSLHGLTVESLVALPFALWFIFAIGLPTAPALPSPALNWILVSLSGIITTLPLLAFAAGARLLPLSTLGQMQFIAPTLQFTIGILCGEQISTLKLCGFCFIWIAVAIYLRAATKAA